MKSATPQIRNLLVVLGSGVAFAFLIVAGLISYYGPSGAYRADHLLLAPNLAQQMADGRIAVPSEDGGRLFFSRIDIRHFDDQDRLWKTRELPFDRYEKLYRTLSGDRSVKDVTDEHIAAFHRPNVVTMVVTMQKEDRNHRKAEERRMLEAQFLMDEDLFRIELVVEGSGAEWAYFQRKGVAGEVKEILRLDD